MTTPDPMAVAFFFHNAGYSYDPATESPLDGRQRCAESLASAEEWAKDHGVTFQWEDDWDVDHLGEYAYEVAPTTCESCLARDKDGTVLASLGCIDDASDAYRRVIEAELADEARYEVDHRPVTLHPEHAR